MDGLGKRSSFVLTRPQVGQLAQVSGDLDIPVLCCGLRTYEQGKAIKEGSQVEIGGNERYVAMCRKHFREAMR